MAGAATSFFEICIRRPIMTSMMSLALVVFGALGGQRLSVRELPDVDPTVVNVLTVYPGASAEVVESEVTEPLEEQIASAEAIRILSSQSREQVSSITVEFVQGRDIDIAAQDVRDRVARARDQLPEAIDEPVVSKQDANAEPIMWIGLTSDRLSLVEISKFADNVLKDRLQTVAGVSQVYVAGEKKFAIRIRLDPDRMAAHAITVDDVERAIRQQNVELPSGQVESEERELTIQIRGQLKTPAEFDRVILRQDGAEVVRLADVGRAEAGVEDERAQLRYNHKPTVGLGIVRQSRGNTVEVARGVRRVLQEIQPQMPPGLQWAVAFDSSLYIERAVKEVFESLGIAFVMVVLTIFLFLRDIRATLVPALSVPVSVIATFGMLYAFGFSINIFTLLALVLAIGIVVDDSIVVLENIHRHIESGLSGLEAAAVTMREIAFAIVTITMSLVAVFLPLAFLTGITGRLLVEFAAALVCAVLVSAFVSLTLAPTIGARVLRSPGRVRHGGLYVRIGAAFDRLYDRYARALSWSLRHRVAILAIGTASVAASGYFFLNLQRDFLPSEDKGHVFAIIISPEGANADYSNRMSLQVERILDDFPEVENQFAAVAPPFSGPGESTTAYNFVKLRDGDRRHVRDIVEGPAGLGARFFNEVEGAFAFPITPKAIDVGFGQSFQLVLSHPNLEVLAAESERLVTRLQEGGMLANVRSTFELTKPEIRVGVDRDRAGTLGVSIEEISRTLQILMGDTDISEVKLDGKEYDVIAKLARGDRLTTSDLERIHVRNERGELVQLANVVSLDTGAGPNRIERFQRARSTTIEGTPQGVPLGTVVKHAEAVLAESPVPGVTHDWKGEARNLRESGRDILFLFVLAVVVVYMVLAAQFESLVHPFTVLLALPLAFLGAFGALYALSWVDWMAGMLYGWVHYAPEHPSWAVTLSRWIPRIPAMNLNVFSEVGLVILVGLVTKNSILLVEFANQRRAAGADAVQAMLDAGRTRLRPILMTSLATIAGILPIAIGFGEAAESRRPLGVVAVGGLTTSTLLTLFVVPVFYTLFADIAAWRARRAATAARIEAAQ